MDFSVGVRKCETIGSNYANICRSSFSHRSNNSCRSLGCNLCIDDCGSDSLIEILRYRGSLPLPFLLTHLSSNPRTIISAIRTSPGGMPSMLRNLYRLFSRISHQKSLFPSIPTNSPAMDDDRRCSDGSRYLFIIYRTLDRRRHRPLYYGSGVWNFDFFASCSQRHRAVA